MRTNKKNWRIMPYSIDGSMLLVYADFQNGYSKGQFMKKLNACKHVKVTQESDIEVVFKFPATLIGLIADEFGLTDTMLKSFK